MKLFSLKSVQFSQFMTDIQTYLAQATGSVKNINKSTVFGQLMTVISAIAHNIMMYIEDSLVEQNKYAAQRKKSVYGLAAQSGYQPSYGKAAGVWVRIMHKPNNGNNLDLIVPNHTRLLCSQNGLYYNMVLDRDAMTIKCDTAMSNEYIYAVQGKFETQRFVSTGGKLYAQNIKFVGFVDADFLSVKINDKEWKQVASLYDMEPNAEQYYLRYNPVGGVDLVFGNAIHGKPLNDGDVIIVNYLLHDGESGNVDTKENAYFVFANNLLDISGTAVDPNKSLTVKFATADAVASGADSEDIRTVRNMIGFNSRSLVLADSNAYRAFLNKYSYVGYNRTWSEPGSLVVNSLVMRNYKLDMNDGLDYFAVASTAKDNIRENKFLLSAKQKDQIIKAVTLSGQQIAGSVYNIVDIELVRYSLYVYIRLKDTEADHQLVSTKVRKLIGEFFGDIQSDSYIPKSDIINLIKNNVPEIDGVTCYFLSERNEVAQQKRYYTDKTYSYDPATGTFHNKEITVALADGENPLLGLDAHGNILVDSDHQFPVLAGGWKWTNSEGQDVDVVDPLTIIFE